MFRKTPLVIREGGTMSTHRRGSGGRPLGAKNRTNKKGITYKGKEVITSSQDERKEATKKRKVMEIISMEAAMIPNTFEPNTPSQTHQQTQNRTPQNIKSDPKFFEMIRPIVANDLFQLGLLSPEIIKFIPNHYFDQDLAQPTAISTNNIITKHVLPSTLTNYPTLVGELANPNQNMVLLVGYENFTTYDDHGAIEHQTRHVHVIPIINNPHQGLLLVPQNSLLHNE
ncbi:hypothetical protein FRX31_011785, partial [Thalictrum thalictroides]